MAGTRSLIIAAGISLGLHAAVLVVPVGGGHYSSPRGGTTIQVSLNGEPISPPLSNVAVFVDNEQLNSRWIAAPDNEMDKARMPENPPVAPGWLPLPSPPKPIYFTAGELHLRPSPIGTVLKEEAGQIYPDSSTQLLIQINEQGRVDHAEILSATNEALASEVLQAFANARYIPGAIAGRKVKSELRVEVISNNDLGVQLRPIN